MYLVKRNKYYHVYFRDVGGRLKSFSTKTKVKKDAQLILNEMKSVDGHKPELHQITYSDFVSRYKEYLKLHRSQSYLEQCKYAFNALGSEVGDKYLSEITHSDIEAMINRRVVEGKKTSTNSFIGSIKSGFNKAIEWELLEDNPARKIKKLKLPINHPVYITESEFKRLIKLEDEPLARTAYIISFYTGCRISELLNLQWDDLDLKNNNICIRNNDGYTTKSKKQRDVPMHAEVRKVMRNLQRKNDYLLQGVYTRRRLSQKFKLLVRSMPDFNQKIHYHSLRHSFASCLLMNGVSIFVVQKLLGHSSVTTTQIYSHLTMDTLRNAVNTLGRKKSRLKKKPSIDCLPG